MSKIFQRLLHDPGSLALALAVGLVYLFVFQLATGDLSVDAAGRPLSLFVVTGWESLVFRARAPFQFEAVAIVEAPLLVWLVSPMNIAIGLALGLLTGIQIALVRIARRCAVACGVSPAAGVLAGLPGLLAGTACCAPILFILLGLQVTASVVTVMGLMIPAAFALLLAGMLLTARVAARRCEGVLA